MGRMHTHRHGKSHSIRPATLRAPSWITLTPAEVEALVIKYAKDGFKGKKEDDSKGGGKTLDAWQTDVVDQDEQANNNNEAS